ncbi:hypothetical protein LSH36_396g06029 [Paralvinella palmiformis]|uniref:Guanine nucleotide-binding protein subunit gamma n=1 Tax=Paralvinella palmiformis TaxID=53620 RepID=A0AAD9N0M4_9ANNE|nr:hypothetical protein LSH36_396g06029 [Paralvinella palmiformis]
MSSQKQELQRQMNQLRVEASVQRVAMSKTIAELISFMQQQMPSDLLVNGMVQTENPFRDHKSCIIL